MRVLILLFTVIVFCSCEPATYQEISAEVPDVISYQANVSPIISQNCLSCHSVATENQLPNLETYENVKLAVEQNGLLDQISAPSGQGMPLTGRLPQVQIDLISEWAATGFNP